MRRPKPPPATKPFQPTIGLSDNNPGVATGRAAQPDTGLDSVPAGTPFDIDADPAVLRIRAGNAASIGDAEAQAEARRQRLAIQFGDADLARALGLGDATANAAGGNPFSTLGNLRNTSKERTTDLENNLNARNLFFSSTRGKELSREQRALQEALAGARNETQGLLEGISGDVLGVRRSAQDRLAEALEGAASRNIQSQLS